MADLVQLVELLEKGWNTGSEKLACVAGDSLARSVNFKKRGVYEVVLMVLGMGRVSVIKEVRLISAGSQRS